MKLCRTYGAFIFIVTQSIDRAYALPFIMSHLRRSS